MWNRKLVILIVLAIIFDLGHTIDHILRGDLRWPLDSQNTYGSATAGWLALSSLIALMLVTIIIAFYAGYLWICGREVV